MDFQKYLDDHLDKMNKERFDKSPQLSLGQLIAEIEKYDLKLKKGNSKSIYFDFGSAVPTTLDSWRGVYAELALGYKLTGYDSEERFYPTAEDLLTELKQAIGKEFYGWKGGEFTMDENTPVWVDNPGNYNRTIITGIHDTGYSIIILTQYEPD